MKRCIAIALVFLLMLSGCERRFLPTMKSIDTYEVIRVLGVDKSGEDPLKMDVTFIAEIPHPSAKSEASGGTSTSYELTTITADSVFEAVRSLSLHDDKTHHLGYVDFIIIGEDAAKDDLAKYVDFITRDNDLRFSARFFIARGTSAEHFLHSTTSVSKYVADSLESFEYVINDLSSFRFVNCIDLINMLDNKRAAAVVPAVKCEKYEKEQLFGGTLPDCEPLPYGYAVLKDGVLLGYFDPGYSRGYNFLTQRVYSSPVNVTDMNGNLVALEIIDAQVKTKVRFDGGVLVGAAYKIRVQANFAEQHSRGYIFDERGIDDLSEKLSEVIMRETGEIIGKSMEYGLDCTGLGKKIRMRHPLKWDSIKDSWDELYSTLKIDVSVVSSIARVYDLREPNGSERSD